MIIPFMKMIGFFLMGAMLGYQESNGGIFETLIGGSISLIILSLNHWFEEVVRWIWTGQLKKRADNLEISEQRPEA